MKTSSWIIWLNRIASALMISLLCASCEDSDDDFDHDIPAGMGTLVVNNTTTSDIYVYIAGIEQQKAESDDYEFYDRAPGTYRVALEEKNGDRTWFGDADILEGHMTIMDVYTDFDINDYDVEWRID